jgi:RND superfamily putative drug exporter
MARFLQFPAGRAAKFYVVGFGLFIALSVGIAFGGKFEDAQKNETSSFLPGDTESIRALEEVKKFPGGELAPAVVVYFRDGGLTEADRAAIEADRRKLESPEIPETLPAGESQASENGNAALIVKPVRSTGEGDGFEIAVQEIRDRVTRDEGGLEVKVTGQAGYGLDAINIFKQINGTLLFATALLVLILLIVIYRSPIFWIIPFATVFLAEVSARGFGYLLAETGVVINGQSGGILPVLVFGAGTDYALLLVSRYREELRRHEDKHEAMRAALGTAGPAILASGLTVIAALLTLTLAEVNGTAGLGPIGAMGVALAMISMLTILPALLVICGRGAFWSPFFDTIPHVGDDAADATHGFWRRLGDRVALRPRRVWLGVIALLCVLAAGLVEYDTGLTTGNSFRGEVESVQGQERLASAFPAGATAPGVVIVPDASRAGAVKAALESERELIARVGEPVEGPPGAQLEVVLIKDAFDPDAFADVPALRRVVKQAGGEEVLFGGPTAENYDYGQAADRDNRLIIPLALVVVFLILVGLLRALLAPLLLILTVVVSFVAALGTGMFVFEYVFDFPGVDQSLPLLAFVFLVALGIDYNIFLMARVREETATHGTREGTLRGLAVTGGVITSAGIVLAGTFSALAVLPLVFLTELGFIIAFGVLLDTFIVRSILVPALVLDLGAKVWWPSRLDRGVSGKT